MYFIGAASRAFLALLTAGMVSVFCPTMTYGQAPAGAPQVSVVTLHVQPGPRGRQMVLTPKGMLVPLPGGGVKGNTVQIYVGSNGGYWYTDQTGQTIDLLPYVQKLQRMTGGPAAAATAVPQYAPMPYGYTAQQPVQQTAQQPAQQPVQIINNSGGSSEGSSGGSSGGSTAGTALAAGTAAGLGAMLGSMIMNDNYYNAPYGTPMYYGPGGRAYYYNNGERVELTPNQQAYLYNKRQINQQNQQQAINQAQATSQARYNQRQTNQQNRQQAYQQSQANLQSHYAQQHSNLQQQQQWYQQQLNNNPQRAQAWKNQSSNPFVAQQASGKSRFSREASGSRAGKERSFGGRSRSSRFGSRGGRRGGLRRR